MDLCQPKSAEHFDQIVRHVDAYASKYLEQNHAYLHDLVTKLYISLDLARAEADGLRLALKASRPIGGVIPSM